MKQTMHVKAPDNWVNDPNGFIYYKGKYHLFYQYNPNAPVWGTMHWGHAVSKDLIHWEHQGIALYPSCPGDQDGCFSGSAVEYEGKLHLFYTGIRYLDPEVKDRIESVQLHIVSEDGVHFDNENGKKIMVPPVTDPEIGDSGDTRDPKVWRAGDHWNMVLGTTDLRQRGKVIFYQSTDLENWKFAGMTTGEPGMGWMWECPDLFALGEGHVLVVSPMLLMDDHLREPNQSICFPVTFDENTCNLTVPDTWQFLDYGMDLYAPQSTLDGLGRRILIAWLRMPEAVDGRWNGMFCLPRVVELRNGHVYFRMHPRVRNAFTKRIYRADQINEAGCLLRMHLKNGEEAVVGGYQIRRIENRLIADRSQVYPDIEGARMILKTPEIREGDLLEIIIDRNMIEIYVNDGEYTLSNAVYGWKDVTVLPKGCGAELYTLE